MAFYDVARLKRPGETGPARTGIEFVHGTEQGFTGHNVHVDTRILVFPILVLEGRLSAVKLSNVELHGREFLFQLLLVGFVERLGRRYRLQRPAAYSSPHTCFKNWSRARAEAVVTVAQWIFRGILLMVFLGRVKSLVGLDFRDNGFPLEHTGVSQRLWIQLQFGAVAPW